MKKTLLQLHWLSLDVAIGAVCCGIFFSEKTNFHVLFALGISTWLIYLVDRLLDVNNDEIIQTNRHLFHQKNEGKIKLFVLFLLVLNVINLFFLSFDIIRFGLFLGLLILLYGLAVFKSKINPAYFKEISVSVIYAVGVSCLSNNYELIFSFFLVVWQSLLVFSKYETIENKTYNNFINLIGNQNYWIIIFTILGYISVQFISENNIQNGLLFGMSFLLLGIAIFYKKLVINELYRILGEIIFWIPLLSKLHYD